MAHSGKIAFSFPVHGSSSQGSGNFDTVDIKYLPPNASSSSDLKRVTAVYYLPPNFSGSIQLSDLPNLLVWKWMNASLVAGDHNVAIEYIPSVDTVLNSVSIFTASGNNQTTTSGKLRVVHESGLCVSGDSGDVVETNVTIHGLTGTKHTMSNLQNNTLYAGQKYYIVYNGTSASDYYPAYFSGVSGNYKDNIAITQDNFETTKYYQVEPGPTPKWVAVLTDSMPIFHLTEGQWFIWNGSASVGMNRYRAYRRTSVGTQYQFAGIIGDPSVQGDRFLLSYAEALVGKPYNSEFIWYVGANEQLGTTYGDIYSKSLNCNSSNTAVADTSDESSNERYVALANILYGFGIGKTYVISGNGQLYYNRVSGYLYTLKSGYTSKITSLTPLTSVPTNPQVNEIYYLSQSISSINQTAAHVFLGNGNWSAITFDNFGTYLDYGNFVDKGLLTRVGSNSDLVEEVRTDSGSVDVQYGYHEMVDDTTGSNDKKYYLEINGHEV